ISCCFLEHKVYKVNGSQAGSSSQSTVKSKQNGFVAKNQNTAPAQSNGNEKAKPLNSVTDLSDKSAKEKVQSTDKKLGNGLPVKAQPKVDESKSNDSLELNQNEIDKALADCYLSGKKGATIQAHNSKHR